MVRSAGGVNNARLEDTCLATSRLLAKFALRFKVSNCKIHRSIQTMTERSLLSSKRGDEIEGKFVVSWMRRAMAPKLAVAGVRAAIHTRIIRPRATGHS